MLCDGIYWYDSYDRGGMTPTELFSNDKQLQVSGTIFLLEAGPVQL